MSSSRRRFGLLLALAGVAAVVFFVALAPGPRLRAQHELTTWLQGHWVATTLEIKRIGSVRLFLNPTDRMMTPVLLHVRSWEPNETYWVMRSLRPGQTFVDIGANVGYYTVIASRLVGASGRVFAFEPDPVSFALLERNVALNGLDNVVLEQKAVSNEPGTLRLFIAPANKGDHRIYQPKGEEREFVEIEAVVLDEYFAGDRRGVDFVKIDTQGAEVVILEGMQRILSETPGLRLSIEYWPKGLLEFDTSAERLLELLAAADLRLFDLAGRAGSLPEVNVQRLRSAYPPHLALFTNLLAVKDPGIAALKAQGAILLSPDSAWDPGTGASDSPDPAEADRSQEP